MFRRFPSLTLLGGVIGGIIAADLFHPPLALLIPTALVTVLAAYLTYRRNSKRLAPLFFALALATIAAIQFAHTAYQIPPSHFSRVANPRLTVQIYGQVADWPDLKSDRTEMIIEVDSLGGKVAQGVTGRLLLKISDTTTALQRGDRIEFFARIYPVEETAGAEQFDYGRFLNLKGIFGTAYLPSVLDVRVNRRPELGFYAIVDWLRDQIRLTIQRNLSPVAAALASGFLIGETRDIPVEVYRMFRDSGTLHLMAVSGSNVAVVLGFFYLLLRPFPLKPLQRSGALLIVVVLFAAISYGDPSVMRASVMAALVLLAKLLQRRYDLNHVIALAMLLILLVDPAELFSVGFQLSFATAWGLIFIVPRVTALFARYQNRVWYRWLLFPIIISVVAQICSTPLIAYYFGRLPLISVIANLIIVPLASVALVLILTMLIAHLVLPIAGMFIGGILNGMLLLTLRAVVYFGGSTLPNLEIEHSFSPVMAGSLIAAIFGLIVIAALALNSKQARRWLVATILIFANATLVAVSVRASQDESATVYLTTVPGGIAGLYQPINGKPDLILTGLIDRPYQIEEKVILPWLKDHQVAKMNRCFVLSANYQSLDDLIRLADSCDIEQLFISTHNEAWIRQVCTELQVDEQISKRIRFFGGVANASAAGVALSQNQIDMVLPEGTITFVGSAEKLVFRNQFPSLPTVAVLGKHWRCEADDWIALHELGLDQIVCPKIAQLNSNSSADPHESGEPAVPAYLHQLSKLGELKIDLTQPLSIQTR